MKLWWKGFKFWNPILESIFSRPRGAIHVDDDLLQVNVELWKVELFLGVATANASNQLGRVCA